MQLIVKKGDIGPCLSAKILYSGGLNFKKAMFLLSAHGLPQWSLVLQLATHCKRSTYRLYFFLLMFLLAVVFENDSNIPNPCMCNLDYKLKVFACFYPFIMGTQYFCRYFSHESHTHKTTVCSGIENLKQHQVIIYQLDHNRFITVFALNRCWSIH